MPQVPVLQNRIAPQAAPNIQRQPLQSAAPQIGRGVQNAAQILGQVQLEERRRADRAAVSEALVALSDAETSLLYDPQKGALTRQGKDAFDLPNQIVPEFDRRAGDIAKSLKSNTARAAFEELRLKQRAELNRSLNQHEFTQRERYYDETDEALLASSAASAARAVDNPERIASELEKQEAVLNGVSRRKGWNEAQRAEKWLAVQTKTHEAVVSRFLLDNRFEDAGRYLAANATRMQDATVEQLQRRVILEEEQQYQRAERARKRAGDEITKEGDRLYATGALTPAWIEANRQILDPEDYRYFYRKLRGEDGSGPSDAMLYANLRDRAGRGEDVRTEAREALRRGAIGSTDFDRILGEVEGQRPGWYSRGKDFISTSAAVSDLNPDPAAAQRKARMINDWDDWTQSHPTATDAEARQAAERIVQEFAIIDTSNFTLTKRAPRYLKGTRNAPDLEATIADTVKAFESGQIDRAEFDRQAALIQEWEEALARAPKPKAKTDGR